MEFETIEDNARKVIVGLINKAIRLEYDFIINYPRLIDHLINSDQIHDEQLIKDINYLGESSRRHLNLLIEMIMLLGGEPLWRFETIDPMTHVEDILSSQLNKEWGALSVYQQAKHVADGNRIKKEAGGLFDRFLHGVDKLPPNVVYVDNITRTLDSIIGEEYHHIKIAEDSIATLKFFMDK